MTDFKDIGNEESFQKGKPGKLIYTCNCGWIDLGHVNPSGAKKLLADVKAAAAKPQGDWVHYNQTAWGIPITGGAYWVHGGISPAMQESVALTIFQNTSQSYEGVQEFFGSSSGFSEEDLVSNIIGFNAAADGKTAEQTIKEKCGKILSKEAAIEVWNQTGGITKNRNRKWEPTLHKCTTCMKECPEDRAFPKEFSRIKRTVPGKGFSY